MLQHRCVWLTSPCSSPLLHCVLVRTVQRRGAAEEVFTADLAVPAPLVALCSGARQGKDKPTFSPWKDMGDVVVVKNARHVEFTGRKWDQKVYRWHTGCAPASPGRASCPAASTGVC